MLSRQADRFRVVAITAYGSDELLSRQAVDAGAEYVGLVNGGDRKVSAALVSRNAGPTWSAGPQCLVEAATHPDVRIVINAVVGAAGLEATLAALRAGKRVALANKEPLVMAGDLVRAAAREGGGEVVPVDSEHSAVLQCVTGRRGQELRRLILTASGGPFRDWPADRLRDVSVGDALKHPTWQMGRKITIDSATLANKALEVIEAHHLFGLGYDRIEVVVHPQSIVHAFTEFVDGSILAQLGVPNMELPILYALTHPERIADAGVERFDPVRATPLTFEPLRLDDFPAFALGVAAGRAGGTTPAVFNASNEIAVGAFLDGRIGFAQIATVIEETLERHDSVEACDLETVLRTDSWARETAEAACS